MTRKRLWFNFFKMRLKVFWGKLALIMSEFWGIFSSRVYEPRLFRLVLVKTIVWFGLVVKMFPRVSMLLFDLPLPFN